jgi:CRP/FNR family transcriptional regulator
MLAITTLPNRSLATPVATDPHPQVRRQMQDTLQLISDALQPERRIVHAGDRIYQAGERFGNLYVLNSGLCKVVGLSADGREQLVALKMRGDWLGFDGIAEGRYACDAVALDTGEVWTIRYDALLAAGASRPMLIRAMHEAMSRALGRDRDSLMSVCTLPAQARVAEFLRTWAEALACSGLRTDLFTLRLTRAEIGNYLGLTLETVSRALSGLACAGLIRFVEKGRREIGISSIAALAAFVRTSLAPAPDLLQ